ncbi:MAG: transglycosylase family protein [bacterium]|nr:transglycosylase family protein [bacterium]
MGKILQVLVSVLVLAQQQVAIPVFNQTADQPQNKNPQIKENYTLKFNARKPNALELKKKKTNFYSEVVLPIKLAQEAADRAEADRAEAERKSAEENQRVALASANNQVQIRTAAVSSGASDDAFTNLRMCEAGGVYNRNSGNGYYGAYQYDIGTWAGYGGYPRADLAPPAVQDAKARETQAARGWNPWPACARKLGLL